LVYTETPPSPCAACSGACACGGGACPCGCACSACACGACGACIPPADIFDCSSMEDCFSQVDCQTDPDHCELDSTGQGKGVFKQPILASLAALVNSPSYICSNNQCTAYASGEYGFEEKVNATKYYGQCSDGTVTVTDPDCKCIEPCYDTFNLCPDDSCYDGFSGFCSPRCTKGVGEICTPETTITSPTINMEADVPELENVVKYPVVNRPPDVTATFAETEAQPEQEVGVTCHAVDPDCAGDPEHMDKITRIKWSCKDAAGNSDGCYFAKGDIWHTGGMTEDLATTSGITNDYETTVKFKGSNVGRYQVTCEARDSDPRYPLTNNGIAEIELKNENESNQDIKYCAIQHETGEQNKTVCVSTDPGTSTVNYKAYLFGFDDPNEYETYRWKCDADDASSEDTIAGTKQCAYNYNANADNTYHPSLVMVNKDTDEEIQCNSTISTKITCISKCGVQAWEKDTTADRLSSFSAPRNAEITGNLNRQCLFGGTTTWNVIGGTKLSSTNVSIDAKLDNPGANQCKIQAYVDKIDTNTNTNVRTTCDEAVIDITDKMKWGQ